MKKILLYPLVFVCILCPLCIIARAKPNSGWARFIFGKLAKICPFCKAYKKLREMQ